MAVACASGGGFAIVPQRPEAIVIQRVTARTHVEIIRFPNGLKPSPQGALFSSDGRVLWPLDILHHSWSRARLHLPLRECFDRTLGSIRILRCESGLQSGSVTRKSHNRSRNFTRLCCFAQLGLNQLQFVSGKWRHRCIKHAQRSNHIRNCGFLRTLDKDAPYIDSILLPAPRFRAAKAVDAADKLIDAVNFPRQREENDTLGNVM